MFTSRYLFIFYCKYTEGGFEAGANILSQSTWDMVRNYNRRIVKKFLTTRVKLKIIYI